MDGKPNKNIIWMTTAQDVLDVYNEAIQLAKSRGKKTGDSINEEIVELLSKKKKEIKCLGSTNKDIDLLTGDLRERGIKVLNINEELRKKKRREKDG
jgi:hypothetical protein